MDKIGIVSEIRSATLLSSKNEYLQYPCNVLVHVMERGMDGSIIACTVSKRGAFVTAAGAKFENISGQLPLKYQHFDFVKEWDNLFAPYDPTSDNEPHKMD